MTIGERIKQLRIDRGWTQAELSVHAGIALGVVTKTEQEREKSDLRLSSIRSLAKVFGMTISQLLEGVE